MGEKNALYSKIETQAPSPRILKMKCDMKDLSFLTLGFLVFFIFALIWVIVKNGVDPLIACLIIVPIFILPCLAFFLYLSLVYVCVKDTNIEYRNMIGIRNNLNVSEINSVIWRVNNTKFGMNENVTVKSGFKKFSVETLMVNSDKFFEYILANVSEDKITRRVNKIG